MLTTSLTRQIINESHFTTSPLSLSTVLSKNPLPYTPFFSKAKALCPCLNPLTAAGRADRFAKKAKAKRYHSNQKKGLCSSSFQTNPIIFPCALKARAADAPRSFPQRKKGFLPFPLRKLIGGFLPHPIRRQHPKRSQTGKKPPNHTKHRHTKTFLSGPTFHGFRQKPAPPARLETEGRTPPGSKC